ncbi:MAG: ATP-binding protein [Oscillospiraceae bacterium]
MRKRILRNMFFTTFLGIFFSLLLASWAFTVEHNKELRQSAKSQAEMLSVGIAMEGVDYLKRLDKFWDGHRVTLIDIDGTVVFDTSVDAAILPNHLDYPEVREAVETGDGSDERHSEIFGQRIFYHAIRVQNRLIVRVGILSESVLHSIGRYLPFYFLIGVGLFAVCAVISKRQTARLMAPIDKIDLENPLSTEDGYEELSPLLRRLDTQNRQIKANMNHMQADSEEFLAITENMSEGLVLLSEEGNIIFLNKSAVVLSGREGEPYNGRSYLTLNRSLPMMRAVETVLSGRPTEEVLEHKGREVRISAKPIPGSGALLLLMDITEEKAIEQLHREFSANVSHELKTPLTSISGYAEIIMNGLVKPEDIPAFSGRIYSEAQRLIALLEDILKLSRLDENIMDLPEEETDLYALARGVYRSLESRANLKKLRTELKGRPVYLRGVVSIFQEILYNLYENAIKYTPASGEVLIEIAREENAAKIVVKDNGIGIPEEHHERIFERFYRVDKSHSRETGGTGLGLSIVKNGVEYHGGTIHMDSAPGRGTAVTVLLPGAKDTSSEE